MPIGLSFNGFAVSNNTVCSSPKVSLESPIAIPRARLTDLINASLHPFCQGASADLLKTQVIPLSAVHALTSDSSQFCLIIFSSLLAATS